MLKMNILSYQRTMKTWKKNYFGSVDTNGFLCALNHLSSLFQLWKSVYFSYSASRSLQLGKPLHLVSLETLGRYKVFLPSQLNLFSPCWSIPKQN